MFVKVNVKTPKNQAANCIKTQKRALLGMKKANEILEQKLVDHNEFYWIINCKDEAEYIGIIKKCALGEVMIKKFYNTLIRLITRANKLVKKFKKGGDWIKKFIIRKLNKYYQGQDNELVKSIEAMDEKEFADFVEIGDLKEMQALLAGDLITTDILKDYKKGGV